MNQPAHILDGLALAAIALAIYVALGQITIYGDGFQFVMWVNSGSPNHPVHFLFLPLLHRINGLFGDTVGFYPAARFACALGTAIGVWFTHAACRRMQLGRVEAALVTALVAATPCVLFFATVLEIHGVFFALVGLAFRVAAGLAQRPGIGRAIALGAATAASYTIHASGAAMIMPLGLWVLAERRQRGDAFWTAARPVAVAVAAHVALVASIYVVVPKLLGIRGEDAVDFWIGHHWYPLSQVAIPTLYYEWLAAFAPMSVLFVAGWWRPTLRDHATALAITLIPYWACAIWLIPGGWTEPAGNERGAYLMPLALPAAWIVARALPRVAVMVVLVAALGLSIATVRHHEDAEPTERFAAGIIEHTGERPVSVIAFSQLAMQASMSCLPHCQMYWLGDMLLVPAEGVDALRIALDRTLNEAAAEHRAVVIGSQAMTYIDKLVETHPGARALRDYFDRQCELIAIDNEGFSGHEIKLTERDR